MCCALRWWKIGVHQESHKLFAYITRKMISPSPHIRRHTRTSSRQADCDRICTHPAHVIRRIRHATEQRYRSQRQPPALAAALPTQARPYAAPLTGSLAPSGSTGEAGSTTAATRLVLSLSQTEYQQFEQAPAEGARVCTIGITEKSATTGIHKKGKLVLRMPTALHERFTACVEEAIHRRH